MYVGMIELLRRLIWRHNILAEEVQGLKSCVISLHNLIHLPEDIQRFSAPDNYWCYTFERAVRTYVERSSNKKNLELTFAKAEARKELLKFLHQPSLTTSPEECEHAGNPQGCLQQVYIAKYITMYNYIPAYVHYVYVYHNSQNKGAVGVSPITVFIHI